MAHTIKALLSLYDEAYQRKYGVNAPISRTKDTALAKQLLGRYSLEQLGGWLPAFFDHRDPFIAKSGHTFGVFVACIGKVIAVAVKSDRPQPTGEVVELARSIARANREHAELAGAGLRKREAELIAQGRTEAQAVFQASQEWLRK